MDIFAVHNDDGVGVNEPAVGRVYVASAKLTDTSAMAQLLAVIPNGDELRGLLDEMGSGHLHAYHAQTRTARYVASDGDIVTCFTVMERQPGTGGSDRGRVRVDRHLG